MNSTKLTSKFQATIPKEIRELLQLKAGDSIAFYASNDGTVVVKKVKPLDKDYLELLTHTLANWSSAEDDEAFKHLQEL